MLCFVSFPFLCTDQEVHIVNERKHLQEKDHTRFNFSTDRLLLTSNSRLSTEPPRINFILTFFHNFPIFQFLFPFRLAFNRNFLQDFRMSPFFITMTSQTRQKSGKPQTQDLVEGDIEKKPNVSGEDIIRVQLICSEKYRNGASTLVVTVLLSKRTLS